VPTGGCTGKDDFRVGVGVSGSDLAELHLVREVLDLCRGVERSVRLRDRASDLRMQPGGRFIRLNSLAIQCVEGRRSGRASAGKRTRARFRVRGG
jgi:hypothetical protein